MPSFRKGGGSCNSHEMRLSGMMGMDILISRSHRTYNANIEIEWGSIAAYTSKFWLTLADNSTSFLCGGGTIFHASHNIYMSVKVQVPKE